jgi:hypothetical protein
LSVFSAEQEDDQRPMENYACAASSARTRNYYAGAGACGREGRGRASRSAVD